MKRRWLIQRKHDQLFHGPHGWVEDSWYAYKYPTAEDAAQALKTAKKENPKLMEGAAFVQAVYRDPLAGVLHVGHNPFGFKS